MAPRLPKKTKRKGSKNQRTSAITKERTSGFPYFAHEQLEKGVFPIAIGLPVGGPGRAPIPGKLTKSNDNPLKHDYSDNEGTEDIDAASPNTQNTLSRVPSRKPYMKSNPAGGRPAIAKKVTADLDFHDDLMVQMANAKYRHVDIAKRIAEVGGMKYNPKTIGTRLRRIRKKQREHTDRLLDQQRANWHDGDDEALRQAYQKAAKDLAKQQQELEAKRWRMVADHLKDARPVTDFSPNACKARLEAFENGTAKPTPESITDPDDETRERVQARRNKARKIQQDTARLQSEVEGNGERAAPGRANLKGDI